VTSDWLQEARTICERAFSFLVTDFGYRKVRGRFQWSGFELGYRGALRTSCGTPKAVYRQLIPTGYTGSVSRAAKFIPGQLGACSMSEDPEAKASARPELYKPLLTVGR
jgi:hypothetical protein